MEIIQILYIADPLCYFFVLSGYLIGGILLHRSENGLFTGKQCTDFLKQRFLRTLPVYFFTLVTIILCRSLNDDYFSTKDTWPYFFFLQNLRSYDIYFFEESWSMSIEVWFYVGIALAFVILAQFRLLKPASLLALIACATISGITLLRYYKFLIHPPGTINEWGTNFRSIVTTALDVPMYGVLASCIHYHYSGIWRLYRKPAAILFLLLSILLGVYMHQHSDVFFTSLFACVFLYSYFGAAIIILLPFFSEIKNGKGFFHSVVTYLSLRSYSLYLVHSSIVINFIMQTRLQTTSSMLKGYGPLGYAVLFVSFWVLSLGLSELIYRLIEVPFTRYRKSLKTV